MDSKKKIVIFIGCILLMFLFITFAGGTPENQAIATRNVTFLDGYNNSEIDSQQVIVGEDAEVPNDPNHNNMVFVGWYLNEDRDQRITDFTNITENMTVIALYAGDRNGNGRRDDEDATYTVTFMDSINNTVISRVQVLEGMNATAPRIPVHTGYTFTGWSRGYNNVTGNITVNTVYRRNNLIASVNRYTVSFTDGITNEVFATREVEEGLSVSVPTPPVHDGYTFVRWDGEIANINSNRNITGIYAVDSNNNGIPDDEEIRYTVSYFANINGVEGTAPRYDRAFLTGQSYTVLENTFRLNGGAFIGWTTNREAARNLVESREQARSLSLIRANQTLIVNNNNISYYAVFAKDINNDGTPDYEETQYNLTYVLGGDSLNIVEKHVRNEVVNLQTTNDLSENIKFIGWTREADDAIILTKKDKGKTINLLTSVTFDEEDITLYAVYAKYNETTGKFEYEDDLYSVKYVDAINNQEILDEEQYVEGEEYSIKKSVFTFDKHVFVGWTTSEEVGKKVLTVTDTEPTIVSTGKATMGNSDITYYAVWAEDKNNNGQPDYKEDENKVILTYVTKDETESETHVKGENITLKSTNDLSNDIKFFGWSTQVNEVKTLTKENNGEVINTITTLTINDNTSVYAIYAKYNETTGKFEYEDDLYSVKYVDAINNQEILDDEKYVEGEEYSIKESVFTFDKHVFVGWTTSEEVGNKILTVTDTEPTIVNPGKTTMGNSDITYYAIWAEDKNNNGQPDYKEDENKVTLTYVTKNDIKAETHVKGENITLKSTSDLSDDIKFIGWSTEVNEVKTLTKENNGEVVNTITTLTINDNTSVYAIYAKYNETTGKFEYEDNLYSVKYVDAINNKEVLDEEQYVEGEEYSIKENVFTFDKHIFVGWTASEEVGKKVLTVTDTEPTIVNPGKTTMGNSDIIYYAIWAEDKNNNGQPDYKEDENKVTLTFVTKDETKSEIHVKGEKITLPIIDDIDEYTKFYRWSLDAGEAKILAKNDRNFTFTMTVGEITLNSDTTAYAIYAKYNSETDRPEYLDDLYTVKYDGNLVASETVDNEKYLKGEEYSILNNMFIAPENTTFIGWTREVHELVKSTTDVPASIIKPGDKFKMVEGGIKYYAVWAIDENKDNIPDYDQKYTASINVIGGSSDKLIEENIDYFSTVEFNTAPKDGYTDKYATATCTNGQNAIFENNKLTINNISNNTVCTIEYLEDHSGTGIPDDYRAEIEVNIYKEDGDSNSKTYYLDIKEDNKAIANPLDIISIENSVYSYSNYESSENIDFQNNTYVISNITEAKNYQIDIELKKPRANLIIEPNSDKTIEPLTFSTLEEEKSFEIIKNPLVEGYTVHNATLTCDNENAIVNFDNSNPKEISISLKNINKNTTCTLKLESDSNNDGIADKFAKKVTFTTNGHDDLLEGNKELEVSENTTLAYWNHTLPNIIEKDDDNLAFEKWEIDGQPISEEEILNYQVKSDITFKAIFSLDSDNNGKADENELVTVNYEVDDTLHATLEKTTERLMPNTSVEFPTVITEKGYEYAWYENDQLVNSAVVKENDKVRTFTAKITQIDYTVKFDYNNPNDKNVIKNDYHYGEVINVPADPKTYRDDTYEYRFIGWFLSDAIMTNDDLIVKESKTFVAKYNKVLLPKLTVQVSPEDWTKESNVKFTLSANKDIKEYNYSLDGGKTWTRTNNIYTFTSNKTIKQEVMFKAIDSDGIETKEVAKYAKIDKDAPIFNINKNQTEHIANIDIKITDAHSGLNASSVTYIREECNTVDEYKAALKKNGETITPPHLNVTNGTASLKAAINGTYTIYAEDNAGNASVTVIKVSGLKEDGIQNQDAGKDETTPGITVEYSKTEFSSTDWLQFIWRAQPKRTMKITSEEGYQVKEVKWAIGREDETYFANNGNIVNPVDSEFTIKGSYYTDVYSIYVKYIDKDGNEQTKITYIFAEASYRFFGWHRM